MTPEQMEEAAIEAAFKLAHEKGYGIPHLIMRAAIEAYNAAMPKPKQVDQLMDANWHSIDVNSERVRLFGDKGIYDIPLPKPPVKS
jgi:hypothetical protein